MLNWFDHELWNDVCYGWIQRIRIQMCIVCLLPVDLFSDFRYPNPKIFGFRVLSIYNPLFFSGFGWYPKSIGSYISGSGMGKKLCPYPIRLPSYSHFTADCGYQTRLIDLILSLTNLKDGACQTHCPCGLWNNRWALRFRFLN